MAKKAARTVSRYGVHPAVFMVQKWTAQLPAKTGRSLEDWLTLIAKKGPKDVKALRSWLKDAHGLGANLASWLADTAAGTAEWDGDPDTYLANAERAVEAMFAGARAGLRPAYDALLAACLALGDDVKACPCKTIVPIYREHVIAQIKPSTRTRIDFGLALGETKASGRLIATGGFEKKDRITHRVEVAAPGDVDADLRRWLRRAYDRDGDARG